MTKAIKIDFISDLSCPWCIIGLRGLEEALKRTSDLVDADLHFHPFELNPMMAKQGESTAELMLHKYGGTPEQSENAHAMVKARAAEVGFAMNNSADSRVYNSFDAHRLLYWARIEGGGRQQALKNRLFEAYFTDQRNISDPAVLTDVAGRSGLDAGEAAAVLASDRYAEDVRQAEHFWQSRGIRSVPAMVINDRYLISGGQPPDALEQALRGIAAELADA